MDPLQNGDVVELYKGLQALSVMAFPKMCATCGERYETVDDFVSRTRAIRKSSGLKQNLDDDDQVIVNLFRNCTCGSTLMDEFNNRRDLTEAGIRHREKFGELLNRLVETGVEPLTARTEVRKVLQGQGSKLLKIDASGKKYI